MSKVMKTKHYTEDVFQKAINNGTLDSGIDHDYNGYTVVVWVDGGPVLKIGGPYKTEQTARFAERKMCAL